MTRTWLEISAKDYHELPAFGSGALKSLIRDGNLDFYARYVAKVRKGLNTDAFRTGRAFHTAMEMGSWQNNVMLIPSVVDDPALAEEVNESFDVKSSATPCIVGELINSRLESHRRYVKHHREIAEAQGMDWVTEDERDRVKLQVEAVLANPEARQYLGLKTEQAAILEHRSGVALKALCDATDRQTVIVDWKTTKHANPYSWLREAYKLGYQWQAGLYGVVTGIQNFVFGSVTNEPPYECNVWEVPTEKMAEWGDTVEEHAGILSQMLLDTEGEVDALGIPALWHSEGWGAALPFDMDAWESGKLIPTLTGYEDA